MTWRTLDKRTDGMLSDLSPYGLEVELDGSGMSLDDQVIGCNAINWLIEGLEQLDFPSDHESEYLDNVRLIKTLKAI